MKPHPLLIAALAWSAVLGTAGAADAWPQFRGPTAQGFSDSKGVPLQWSETEHVAWKTPLPGEGWSSPVVANGAIWVTAALDGGKSLHAIKVDFASGKLISDIEVFTNEVVPLKHARNSHASPTPIIDGDRVYVHFGTMGTACLSTVDGHKIWENRTLKVDHEVGAGGSPTLYHDRLLITCDGVDADYEVALDKLTGKVLWKVERSGQERLQKLSPSSRKCFGTPVVLTVNGKDQSLTTAAERLHAYDPLTGKELWYVDYTGYSNASLPVSDGRMLIIGTGFNSSSVWGIALGGASGDATASHVKWKLKLPGLSQPSPLLIDGRAYVVNDSGILHCLDSLTGAVLWKERIGSDFAASPIYVDGRMYFCDCLGKTTVIAPGTAAKVLATNQLDDGFMASPAVVGKSLVLRSKKSLYRIE